MDTVLFERRGPKIALTPEGRALYELASPLVEGIDNLPDAFAERCGDLDTGEIHIAAGESTILYLLPSFVERFAAACPGIEIRLHNVTGRDGLERLRADSVDFAVGAMLDTPADIVYQPIFTYPTVLITPHDHPLTALPEVTLDDIAPYGLILPPRHLSTWRIVDIVFPAAPGGVQGEDRGGRLGGHQALRRARSRHLDRVQHLHDGGGSPGRNPARCILPQPDLRRGAASREVPFSRGTPVPPHVRFRHRHRPFRGDGRRDPRDIVPVRSAEYVATGSRPAQRTRGTLAAPAPEPVRRNGNPTMADRPDPLHDDESAVQEARPKLKRPPLYNVVLLNDDYTPMEFVVHVLELFFGLPREQSVRIMLHVHTRGKGVCGCYARRDRGDEGGAGERLFPREQSSTSVYDGACVMREAED